MLVAHYLIVVTFSQLNFNYVRLVGILVPAAAGFLLFWNERRSWPWALLAAASMAVLTVAGMLITITLIDAKPFIPSTVLEWQEAVEFLASIALATVGGDLLARMLGHSRLHIFRKAR
jgi:ABC-type phosphate transport system auxiliary subunit